MQKGKNYLRRTTIQMRKWNNHHTWTRNSHSNHLTRTTILVWKERSYLTTMKWNNHHTWTPNSHNNLPPKRHLLRNQNQLKIYNISPL